MNNTKKTVIAAVLIVSALIIIGFFLKGSRQKAVNPQMPQQNIQTASDLKQTTVEKTEELPPLPASNVEALDGEIKTIDQELENMEKSLTSGDSVDADLGL